MEKVSQSVGNRNIRIVQTPQSVLIKRILASVNMMQSLSAHKLQLKEEITGLVTAENNLPKQPKGYTVYRSLDTKQQDPDL